MLGLVRKEMDIIFFSVGGKFSCWAGWVRSAHL